MKLSMVKNNNWLYSSDYSKKEEREIYARQLQEIIDDPLWYLENLEYMVEYRVYWGTYTKKTITKPKAL